MSYRRLVIDTLGDLSTVRIDEKEFPVLEENQILVKLEYSTLNPSDFYRAMGGYGAIPSPVEIGIEGSGTVTQTGSGSYAQSLLNTKVSVRGPGTWSEYIVVNAEKAFPLLESTSLAHAANLIVNPMTVLMFVDIITSGGHKVVVQNAAASALGKMLTKWGKIEGVHIVNLVRRDEQVEALRAIGAEHIVNTSEENWKVKAKEIAKSLGGATIGFDAIAGVASSELMEVLENGSTAYTYGVLSGEDPKIAPVQVMMLGKTLKGLMLPNWLDKKNFEERVQVGYQVQNLLPQIFATEHSKTIHLGQIQETLINYRKESATNNKILIRTAFE